MHKITYYLNKEPYKTVIEVLSEVYSMLKYKQLRYIFLESHDLKYKVYKIEEESVELVDKNGANGLTTKLTTKEFKKYIRTKIDKERFPLKNLKNKKPMSAGQFLNIISELVDQKIVISPIKNGYKLSEDLSEKICLKIPDFHEFSPKMIERHGNVWVMGKTLHKNQELLQEIITKSIEIEKIKNDIENPVLLNKLKKSSEIVVNKDTIKKEFKKIELEMKSTEIEKKMMEEYIERKRDLDDYIRIKKTKKPNEHMIIIIELGAPRGKKMDKQEKDLGYKSHPKQDF